MKDRNKFQSFLGNMLDFIKTKNKSPGSFNEARAASSTLRVVSIIPKITIINNLVKLNLLIIQSMKISIYI